ncbi:MAG: prepilin peptidase [Eubacterium sp.]|nr:prepilin peptidase [Eubacterium sp.]
MKRVEAWVPYIEMIMKCLGVVLVSILFGNGAVYVFNHLPAAWLTDYGEEPSEELRNPYTQRIKSHPWKVVFTMFFVIIGIWMAVDDLQFAAAAMCSMWILIELAIADAKYRIVPDQLLVLLAVTALGYIPYFSGWRHLVYGAVFGLGLIVLVALIGRILYRHNTVGGGDIKLFAVLGLIAGPVGILEIFVMSTVFSVVHFLILMAKKKLRRDSTMPMVPYITAAAILYLAFLWGRAELYLSL